MTVTLRDRPTAVATSAPESPGPPVARRRGTASALLRAVRPHQWAKNALVVAAPALGGSLLHGSTLLRTAAAVGAWSLVASAAYLLNDVRDAPTDRLHPTKRWRPIASGALAPKVAIAAAAILGATGLGLAGGLGPAVLVLVTAYVALTVAYSVRLKRLPYVEMSVVAAGFVLRAATGAAATAVAVPAPMMVAIAAVAFLATAGKRLGELHELGPAAARHRKVLGRYREPTLGWFTAGAAGVAALSYSWWAIVEHAGVLALPWTASAVAFALLIDRFACHALRGEAGDPFEVVHHDHRLGRLAVAWTLVTALAVLGV